MAFGDDIRHKQNQMARCVSTGACPGPTGEGGKTTVYQANPGTARPNAACCVMVSHAQMLLKFVLACNPSLLFLS